MLISLRNLIEKLIYILTFFHWYSFLFFLIFYSAKHVLLVDLGEMESMREARNAPRWKNDEHLSAVADRMFRAASGRVVAAPPFQEK